MKNGIKLRIKLKKMQKKIEQIINNNIINIEELERIIADLRKSLTQMSKEKIKEIEIGIELDNLNNINDEVKQNFKIKEKKRPLGSPKKEINMDNKQKK